MKLTINKSESQLTLSINTQDRKRFAAYIKQKKENEEGYACLRTICEDLYGSSSPFNCGWDYRMDGSAFLGLSNAPIIANEVLHNDEGEDFLAHDAKLFYFPQYELELEVETLAETGQVVFQLVP